MSAGVFGLGIGTMKEQIMYCNIYSYRISKSLCGEALQCHHAC
jgi:hypothetical protein